MTGRLVLEDQAAHQLDGADRLGASRRRRQGDAAEPVGAVHVPGGARGLEQRSHGARGDGDLGSPGDIEDAQGVVDDLGERGVARHARDAEHVEPRMPHREQDGEGVVDTRVDVEDDGNAHRITVARAPRRARHEKSRLPRNRPSGSTVALTFAARATSDSA